MTKFLGISLFLITCIGCNKGLTPVITPVPEKLFFENVNIKRIENGPRLLSAQLRNQSNSPLENKFIILALYDSQGNERGIMRKQIPFIEANGSAEIQFTLDEYTQGFRIKQVK